jgi:hypothetical protein
VAIVVNKARPGQPVDGSYCTHTRTSAATPNASVVPAFVGEIIWDLTNKVRWKAVGLLNTDWEPQQAEVT